MRARAALIRKAALLVLAATPACFLFPSFDDFVGDGAPDGGASDAPTGADGTATCDADLARDPKNCGACAHDCQSGACSGGTCQVFTFTSVDGDPSDILATGDGIYVTSRKSATVGVVAFFSHDGKQKKVIATGANAVEPRSMVIVGKQIFWTNQGTRTVVAGKEVHGMSDGFLATASLDDAGNPHPVQSGLSDPYGLTTDGSRLYFTTRGTGCMQDACIPDAGQVLSCEVRDLCAKLTMVVSKENGPRRILAAGGQLYWTVSPPDTPIESGRIRTAPVAGDAGTNLTNDTGIYDIALDPSATALFASTTTVDGGFTRIPLGVGTPATVPLTLEGPRGVGVDERNAYLLETDFGRAGKGALYRIDLASLGAASNATKVVSGMTGQSLALSADAVYFTYTATDGTGTVRKLVK